MAVPCYKGDNPITDEERFAIWRWAKDNAGIDKGAPIEQVHKAINDYFFGGQAKPEWINDILSGRKTPYRSLSNELWRKAYNRRSIAQQAAELSKRGSMGPVARWIGKLTNLPRSVAVFGHGIVFPFTHAGDIVFRPQNWGQFIQGTLRTYHAAFSSAYTGRLTDNLARDELYDLALRSGVDVGPTSHPAGLIALEGGKTGFFKAAARSWDALTVMRYELWKSQVKKHLTEGMPEAEALDFGKNYANWANHATGSGKGPIASLGGNLLFGPKLTQSKLNRLAYDPLQTAKTFYKMAAGHGDVTPGERAVAWTRLSGATQYLTTTLGFMAVNQGLLQAFGQKAKINWTNPEKGDYWMFKGGGILASVPGMHSEIRALSRVLALAFTSRKELRGEKKLAKTGEIAGQYGMSKLTPSVEKPLEAYLGENYQGRPLPWSKEPGTKKFPRMTWGEYYASMGPIPLEGPTGYVYDQIRKTGASRLDATQIVKGLIIAGLGVPGLHVREDYYDK